MFIQKILETKWKRSTYILRNIIILVILYSNSNGNIRNIIRLSHYLSVSCNFLSRCRDLRYARRCYLELYCIWVRTKPLFFANDWSVYVSTLRLKMIFCTRFKKSEPKIKQIYHFWVEESCPESGKFLTYLYVNYIIIINLN